MFGVSFGELVIIAIVGLVLFGPEKLPELARSYGKFMARFSQTLESVQQEYRKGMEDAQQAAEASTPGVSQPELETKDVEGGA